MAESTAPGRREAAKTAKRGRILAAAEARLRGEGYEAMTMAQVAADADVAIGTVFNYAATKAELLMMVTAQRWAGSIPRVLAAIDTADPVAAIEALLRPVVDTARLDPPTSAAVARELFFGAEGEHRQAVVELVDELEEAIARLLAGGPPEPHHRDAARLVIAGGMMEVHRRRTGRTDGDLQTHLRRIIDIAVRGTADRSSPLRDDSDSGMRSGT